MVDEVSGGAVLYRDTPQGPLYLLLHYESGHWDHPKGHLEAGENAEQAARREISEETGITDITFVPGFHHIIRYKYKRDGRLLSKQVDFFVARTTEERVVISHEHQGHAWLPYPEARERLTFKNARALLAAAQAHVLALSGS